MRRLLVLFAVLALFLAACSSSDDDNQDSGSGPDQTSAGTSDGADDDGDDGGSPVSAAVDTAGLKAFLDESYPGEGYSSEVSLLSVGDATVLVNVQTSFFEPDEAVAFCEAVAEYLDAAGAGSGPLELVSTSGDDVAMRTVAGGACEPGADL